MEPRTAEPASLAEWVVLAVVDERPTHGFAVAALTAPDGDLGRVWQVRAPVVYRALARLEADGLVVEHAVEPGRGPRRRVLASTPAGGVVVRQWLDVPVDHVRDVRSELLLKLALRDRRRWPSADLVRRQREVLTPIAGSFERPEPREGFDAVLAAWRRSAAAATLAFLDDVAAQPSVRSSPATSRGVSRPRA